MKNKHKEKKAKQQCFNIKKYFVVYMQSILVCYISVLYMLIFLYEFILEWKGNFFDKFVSPFIVLILFYILSAIITVTMFSVFCRQKDVINGICFSVLEKCRIREQYKRFIEIKKCIETYKDEHGKCEIKTNVNVIAASIAFDSAKCIVYPILLTAIAFVIPDSDNLVLIRMIIGIPTICALWSFARSISRNAFIKKVIECINDEQGFNVTQ